jgi:hypothetical protein
VKVLALYDIHGNVDALDAVLADPSAASPDAIVVGGDAVPGPFARAVLDRLDALGGSLYSIRGNGERETAEAAAATRPPADDDLAGITAAATASELGADRARALGNLPLVGRTRRRALLPRHSAGRQRDGHASFDARTLRQGLGWR